MTDPSGPATPSEVAALATRQLAAYNDADLDAFVACYAPDVVVFDGDEEVIRGIADFRARYAEMFAGGGFGATVDARVECGEHLVEREAYWRVVDPDIGERQQGELLVRYTARQGSLAVVQFLRRDVG